MTDRIAAAMGARAARAALEAERPSYPPRLPYDLYPERCPACRAVVWELPEPDRRRLRCACGWETVEIVEVANG
jgi:hypothetical protein